VGCLCLDNPTPFGTLSPARPAGLFFVEPIPALGIVLAAEDQRLSFRNAFLAPLRRGFSSAIALSMLSNRFSISARRSRSIWSTRFRRSISASTVIRDRFMFDIVISGEKTE